MQCGQDMPVVQQHSDREWHVAIAYRARLYAAPRAGEGKSVAYRLPYVM